MAARKNLTQEEVQSRLKKLGYEAAGPYVELRIKMLVRCPKHDFVKAVRVNNLFRGARMACCCPKKRGKYTTEEVSEKLLQSGYILVGEYIDRNTPVAIRCNKHNFEKPTFIGNIFSGGSMACCGKESMIEKHRINNKGNKNPFFGKKHSIETREKLSKIASNQKNRPSMPEHVKCILMESNTGKPRSEETKRKLRQHSQGLHKIFEYCVRKAENGKTAGKQGIFYIVRIGEFIKFGSATTTMSYRLARMKKACGCDVELKLYCMVDDAGKYEAMMMNRMREHWSHGEYFYPSVLGAA